ncbi:thioredoxin family protein [Aneurinibacillus thermoaerophilus]|uniref:Thioredoxin family protein n=1 Tax=Aneurinibacillus thermoaerophilus TaxID=143495 RepID=A0ABX8YEI2_ANETH|nr:thioredoxin family protein [Aneurinibacillus thermoaerophilus]MED0737726.1 thioredoxin family protein [Aneurinibacillus thermoaerophilus]QYY43509.1 thioredoxin family protein [Aneurinibacillus thermoaerophilus]
MGINLKEKFNTGLTPAQFMEGMTKNKEVFHDWYHRFTWPKGEKAFFTSLRQKSDWRCLILAADWCGDVVRNAPDYEEKIKEARAKMRAEYGEGTKYQETIVRELREVLSSLSC